MTISHLANFDASPASFQIQNGGCVMTVYYRFSCDVTPAMLVYRTIAKKVFWKFDSIIMQN